MRRRSNFRAVLLPLLACLVGSSLVPAAVTADDPKTGNRVKAQGYPPVLGQESSMLARYNDTFADLADRYHLGYNELVLANPGIDPWLPKPGTTIVLPARHIVPRGSREGVLINLSEYRMYVFDRNGKTVETFPIGIGTIDFPTPVIETTVVMKLENPTWYPPISIRRRHLEEDGEVLPSIVPPGPDNPLGPFAIKLAADGYLIHGTNKPMGIGMAVSHGCIRMNNADISKLVKQLPDQSAVRIVREPVKVALAGPGFWAEVHPDENVDKQRMIEALAEQVRAYTKRYPNLRVDSAAVRRVLQVANGRPEKIGGLQTSLAHNP